MSSFLSNGYWNLEKIKVLVHCEYGVESVNSFKVMRLLWFSVLGLSLYGCQPGEAIILLVSQRLMFLVEPVLLDKSHPQRKWSLSLMQSN
jgi:hypothetical protein